MYNGLSQVHCIKPKGRIIRKQMVKEYLFLKIYPDYPRYVQRTSLLYQNQEEESICIQRLNLTFLSPICVINETPVHFPGCS